jgi:hypothetical protein
MLLQSAIAPTKTILNLCLILSPNTAEVGRWFNKNILRVPVRKEEKELRNWLNGTQDEQLPEILGLFI